MDWLTAMMFSDERHGDFCKGYAMQRIPLERGFAPDAAGYLSMIQTPGVGLLDTSLDLERGQLCIERLAADPEAPGCIRAVIARKRQCVGDQRARECFLCVG